MKVVMILFMILGFQVANADDIILTTKNHCSLKGRVTSGSMQGLKFCLADKMARRRAGRQPIYLVINSGGGEIYSGLRFIEFAKNVRNLKTITIYAASMASAIVEAIPGERIGTENAITMFHRAKGNFKGQFEDGEVESQLKLWKKIVQKMEQSNSDRIGITLKDYKSKIVNEWWAYADDNVKEKILDRLENIKCSDLLLSDKKKVTVRSFLGSSSKMVSACPLLN